MRAIPFESVVTVSQAEFAEWVAVRPWNDLNHYELLNGRILMNPPAGWPHGSVGTNLQVLIGSHVRRHRLGQVFDSSQGFELPSGDTLEPDHSFVSAARWKTITPEKGKFLQVVPNLVVETLSSNASTDRGEKKGIYEHNGVEEYWLVDSSRHQMQVFALKNKRFDLGVVHLEGTSFRSKTVKGLIVSVARIFDYG